MASSDFMGQRVEGLRENHIPVPNGAIHPEGAAGTTFPEGVLAQ